MERSEAVTGPADPLDEFFWRSDEKAPGLDDLVLGGSVAVAGRAPDARREWLTFFLGYEEYALEIGQVREVLKAPPITEVPQAPKSILGVIMVRGEVIAVFDPKLLLGLPRGGNWGKEARVIVCDAGQGPHALIVDAVSQVARLPSSAIEARPTGLSGSGGDYISGIGREGHRIYILLDLTVLLGDGARAKTEPS